MIKGFQLLPHSCTNQTLARFVFIISIVRSNILPERESKQLIILEHDRKQPYIFLVTISCDINAI